MDERAAKLALARKKLKDHQEKKCIHQKDVISFTPPQRSCYENVEAVIIQEEQDVVDIQNNVHNGANTVQNTSTDSVLLTSNETKERSDVKPQYFTDNINATEILISSKRNLEIQVQHLQSNLSDLQEKYILALSNHQASNQTIQNLENDLRNVKEKCVMLDTDLSKKDNTIQELCALKSSLIDENNNYQEQLEFTKSMLTAKETENNSLHSQLFNLQNQLEVTQLQLQQLTNGTVLNVTKNKTDEIQQNEVLVQKISNLEQQIKDLQKERSQINVHYEHYVSELNEQLKSVIKKNEVLTMELQHLSNRENSLIEQISDMEIRLQSCHIQTKDTDDNKSQTIEEMQYLQSRHEQLQHNFQELNLKYNELDKKYKESIEKIEELCQHQQESHNEEDTISISKLNADIASDKIAAQRATEQNKKLKQDIQGLEDAFVKMSQDKLELTEKLTAEKYLNRQLTIKLAEMEENCKDMKVKLKAKDEEMIRLQATYRNLDRYENSNVDQTPHTHTDNIIKHNDVQNDKNSGDKHNADNNLNDNKDESHIVHTKMAETVSTSETMFSQSPHIAREDAMHKLQQRFLKIMEEVADLSDEKHRLEHIILQLQNETETICEYVALYQQQRSLLKRRDEERSAQIKMFEAECDKLKSQIDELTAILVKLSSDKELSRYLETDSKHKDIQRVMRLLSNLKNNSLIDPQKKNVDFKNFYPCNCCSGKLIEV